MADRSNGPASVPPLKAGDLVRTRSGSVGFVVSVTQRTAKIELVRGESELPVGDLVQVTAEEELRLAERATTEVRLPKPFAASLRKAIDAVTASPRPGSQGLVELLWSLTTSAGAKKKTGAKVPPGLRDFLEAEHHDVFERPASSPTPATEPPAKAKGRRKGKVPAEAPVTAVPVALFEEEPAPPRREPSPPSEIDTLLTAQFAVAWAGESDRLCWWRSELVSEHGGQDLFRHLLPHTWEWAVLQAVREAARRKDVELRGKDHEPDRILSLYALGFELDERVEERLLDLKRSGRRPEEALPGLKDVVTVRWDQPRFLDWVQGHGSAESTVVPAGRRLKGAPPESPGRLARQLVAALAPLTDAFPLPHFVRDVPQ